MQRTKIGDYLLTRLEQCGIRSVFGVPGDFNLTALELLAQRSQMEWVGCCNELNAAYAADGYARMHGAAALMVTYGVGDLSAINGVAGSFAEHVPVICISGIPPMHALRNRMLLHHTSGTGNLEDVLHCMAQFTAAQARITPANAAAEIDRVLCTALREKRPVYLQIPSDIVYLEIEAPQDALDWSPRLADPAQLARAVDAIAARLESAARPAILVDGDAHRFGLRPLVCALGQSLGIPFAAMASGRSIFDEQNPLYRGLYAGDGSPAAETIENSDCLLALGVRFFDSTTGIFTHGIDERQMIQLEPFSVNCQGNIYEGVTAADVLRALGERFANAAPRTIPAPAPLPAFQSPVASSETRLTHASLWPRMERFFTANDVVLAEAGTSFSGICGIRLPAGAAFISQAVWGSIGYTLPAMLGSMKAAPERRHLLFIGDGSLQMTAQEISTLLRHGLQPILFVINNRGYTIERVIYGPDSSYNQIQNWSYTTLPAVFGPANPVRSFSVATLGQLDAALDAISAHPCFTIVELHMDPMDTPASLAAMGPRVAEFDYGKPAE
jgi:indolepyruvate decarboxylase